MKRILFQGDSITDCCRSREDNNQLGTGYAFLVKAELGFEKPNQYEFYNRGVSGDRIVDVYARMKSDIINLKPDYMSILIGVNDVWHDIDANNGVDHEKFEKIYSMLIEEVKEALPELKIMILEPFCLKGIATDNNEMKPNKWNLFYGEVQKRAIKAKAVAEKYNLAYVELQDKFNELTEVAEDAYWLADGVHPTAMGHEMIKREWLKAFEKGLTE